MTEHTFTYTEKKKIRKRINRRAKEAEERLQNISRGRTVPNKQYQLLNEAKSYNLAMVFIDINNFSKYILNNPDKEVLYMLSLFIPEAMKLVREYDGYLEKNTGDGLFAYFGFGKEPNESIADALLYLSTVRWILIKEINSILEDSNIEKISISAGATYGHVYLSRIGERDHEQELNRLTAVSPFANLAYKLEDMADEGQFLTGPRLEQYSGDLKDYLSVSHIIDGYHWYNSKLEEEVPVTVYEYRGDWESSIDVDGEVQ